MRMKILNQSVDKIWLVLIGFLLFQDGYKWKNKNTIQFPNNSMSKTYFYARTPVGTLKDFYKHQVGWSQPI